jgi:uncharacterized protein (TIGR03083 family)
MLDAPTYIAVVSEAIERIADVAAGNLSLPVEHCPGFDVAALLEHTGSFARIVGGRVARDEEWTPPSGTWQQAPPEEVAGDPIGWHRRWGSALVDALRGATPAEPVTTWAGARTRYFWFRRAAQELTVHRWDAEHACGAESPIDDAVALDGVDEFLGEFGTRAASKLAGSGETFQFIADPHGVAFTVTAKPGHLVIPSHSTPDVVGRARAGTLLRFVWGRATPDDLVVEGDRSLLDRWHDLVRI